MILKTVDVNCSSGRLNGKGRDYKRANRALIPGKTKFGDIVTSVLPPGTPATISILYVKAPLPTAVLVVGGL